MDGKWGYDYSVPQQREKNKYLQRKSNNKQGSGEGSFSNSEGLKKGS